MGGLEALKLSSLKSPKQPHTAGHSYQSLGAGARRQQADAPVKDNFVPITGLVHNQTSLGVFIEIARRRVFVPSNCMSSPSAGFEAGEPAVLMVLRRFAEQERLGSFGGFPRSCVREAGNGARHHSKFWTKGEASIPLALAARPAHCDVRSRDHSGNAKWDELVED
jgi:hypothetical protein